MIWIWDSSLSFSCGFFFLATTFNSSLYLGPKPKQSTPISRRKILFLLMHRLLISSSFFSFLGPDTNPNQVSWCKCNMVGQMVMRIVRPCFKPDHQLAVGGGGTRDGLLWYKDTGRHACGDFSMALVQANNLLEDVSQVEAAPLLSHSSSTTFVGIYDGHGGPETAHFIAQHLFPNLKKFATEQQTVSVDVIRKSYAATEEGFLNLVRKQWLIKPQLASVGSCCLVGIINEGVLYVANTGDSRAVLGRLERGVIKAVQLSAEHNASIESVREELRQFHPDDPRIVVLKHNVWRVKGLIQVSRTLGDAYLKSTEFNREPLLARFRLSEPFHKPILSPEPSIEVHKLCTEDQFVIFASDGLWEHMTNQEAVDIVNCSPRNVR